MSPRFQTVLVTGASSGMGKDFAQRLLREGYQVFVAARSVDKMQGLEEAGAIPIRMDISKEEEIVAAVDLIREKTGGVDVLINNAGFAQYGPVEETDVDAARYQFEVNLFGLARLTQLLLPAMRARKAGRIINISSMGGKIYTPLGAWYHATKHALEGWSDCLRMELAPHGIDVVIVEPGAILTSFGDALAEHYAGDPEGPYGALVKGMERAAARSYERGLGSRPGVITNLVLQAIRARRPKVRYVGGAMARPLMILRRVLPDRWFDRLLMSQMT